MFEEVMWLCSIVRSDSSFQLVRSWSIKRSPIVTVLLSKSIAE